MFFSILIFMNRNVIYRALKYVTAVNSNRDTIHLWWTLLQVKTVIYLALNYVTVVSNRGINLPNELAEMNTMLSLRREKAGNSILWSFFSFFGKFTDFHRVKIVRHGGIFKSMILHCPRPII